MSFIWRFWSGVISMKHCTVDFHSFFGNFKTKIARGTKNANRRFERCCKVEITLTNHNILLLNFTIWWHINKTHHDPTLSSSIWGGWGIFMPLTLGAIIKMFIIYCYSWLAVIETALCFLSITAAVCRCSFQLKTKIPGWINRF